ncbi:MAG: hypothetical protein WAM66_10185 [Acidobacteriaceae bacterium]
MLHKLRTVFFLALLAALCSASAHAGKVALLLEQPYGHLGMFTPTGHVAIYLSDVCAAAPVRLRRCDPGETGVVISRYHHIHGYDWMAMPLLPYLYAVDNPQDIPARSSKVMAMHLRNQYRREYLREYIPDDPHRAIPKGSWTELLGESYIRKIYGFSLETSPEQDDEFIAVFNDRKNRSRYNLIFRNCANFAENILNFYYPHSVHRNFIVDLGIMTPKQTARSFQKYARRHPDLEFTTFVIPQVPGAVGRSTPIHGVLDSVLETKKYILPLAVLHPVVAGTLLAIYFGGDGFFHPGAHVESVFNPRLDREPGMMDASTTMPTDNPGKAETSTLSKANIQDKEKAAAQPTIDAVTAVAYQPSAMRQPR